MNRGIVHGGGHGRFDFKEGLPVKGVEFVGAVDGHEGDGALDIVKEVVHGCQVKKALGKTIVGGLRDTEIKEHGGRRRPVEDGQRRHCVRGGPSIQRGQGPRPVR